MTPRSGIPGPIDRLDRLTPRERQVLALMALGRSNLGIARALVVTAKAVEKHVANIFVKLDLGRAAPDDHRRVLAVLWWLGAAPAAAPQPQSPRPAARPAA